MSKIYAFLFSSISAPSHSRGVLIATAMRRSSRGCVEILKKNRLWQMCVLVCIVNPGKPGLAAQPDIHPRGDPFAWVKAWGQQGLNKMEWHELRPPIACVCVLCVCVFCVLFAFKISLWMFGVFDATAVVSTLVCDFLLTKMRFFPFVIVGMLVWCCFVSKNPMLI